MDNDLIQIMLIQRNEYCCYDSYEHAIANLQDDYHGFTLIHQVDNCNEKTDYTILIRELFEDKEKK